MGQMRNLTWCCCASFSSTHLNINIWIVCLPIDDDDDFKLTHHYKLCFRLWPCRDPGHRRLYKYIYSWSISWVLVGCWSWAGELRPQRLSKGDGSWPNGEPRLRPPGCLLWKHLWDLPRGILAAFAEHNSLEVRAQQCNNGGGSSSHRRIQFKEHSITAIIYHEHRVDSRGRLCCPPRTNHCPSWFHPLHHAIKCRYHSGDWWWGHRRLHHAVQSGWRNRDSSHTTGTKTTWSRMWRLPGQRWPTSEWK